MNITIKCDLCGEMEFKMTEEKATQLIGQACMFSSEFQCEPELYEDAVKNVKNYAEKKPEQKLEKPANKVERMFGDYKNRIPIPAVLPKVPAAQRKEQDISEFKGFMYIECEGCGAVRGYYSKMHHDKFHCECCGHVTQFKSLKTMYPKCSKCGATFKYLTNLDDEHITYACLDCHAPIDMELNKRGSTYVTIR